LIVYQIGVLRMNHRIHSLANNSHTYSIVRDLCYAANILHVQYMYNHGELDWSWLDDYSVVVVSYVPSEDGPFGPKHVKDLRS
jgi:hypothetical protein